MGPLEPSGILKNIRYLYLNLIIKKLMFVLVWFCFLCDTIGFMIRQYAVFYIKLFDQTLRCPFPLFYVRYHKLSSPVSRQ